MSFEDNDNTRWLQEQASTQKLDDFNAELSGTKAGYRYVTSASSSKNGPDLRAQKSRKADAQLTALQGLLDGNPAYAAAYAEAGHTITEFEDRMNDHLRQIDEKIEDVDGKLETLGQNSVGSVEHKRLLNDREALQRQQQDLLDYHHTIIQPMKDRMADQNNPPTKDEFDEYNEKVQSDMEDTFSVDHEEQVTSDPELIQTAEMKLPDLGA